MNTTPSVTKPRRHVWRWVLLGLGLCLTPFLILAIVAASFLTLQSDAAVLRKQVMAATDSDWHTKVQLSVGNVSLSALRLGLAFVHDKDVADAKLALAAIRRASVGVYQRNVVPREWAREQLLADADKAMQKRGWARLVGVVDRKDTVLVYASREIVPDQPIDICVAVVNGQELVVVSTSVDAAQLAELVERHAGDNLKNRLHFAKLRL